VTEIDGKWYLFYHDSAPSGGVSSLRSMKVTPLTHRPDGSIVNHRRRETTQEIKKHNHYT